MLALMLIGSLCTGMGMLDHAVQQAAGGDLAWVADNDAGASKLLQHRYPDVPNAGDISKIDWRLIRRVDILTAGFPCQPVSVAGRKLGTADERWLWPEVWRAVRDLQPRLIVLENVDQLLVRGADDVLGGLAAIGYDCAWHCVPAAWAGAPHLRERFYAIAYPHGTRLEGHPRKRRPDGEPAQGNSDACWGVFVDAIRHWEGILGRPALVPAVPGRTRNRLNPAFVEWMMGVPEGWVTGVPGLSYREQIHLLGNGVVVQQAVLALENLFSLTGFLVPA